LPTLYVTHGSPTLIVDDCPARDFLAGLGARLPRPGAVLCVSAHWEERRAAVSAAPRPETIHDFMGFPPALYDHRYAAPGAPALAGRVAGLLREAGISCAVDPLRERGGDPRRLAAAVPRDLADALDPSKDGLGIVASGWYDARIVHALLEAFVGAFPDQELSAITRAASLAGLRSNAGGIYKVVLERLASPGIYARSIQRLWRLLHDTGERTIEIERPGRAVSRIRDWAGHHPMLCVMTNGTMAAMFETMRCRDVRIQRVACVSEGDPECVAIVTWSEGDARA
jgi:hypothetical protein